MHESPPPLSLARSLALPLAAGRGKVRVGGRVYGVEKGEMVFVAAGRLMIPRLKRMRAFLPSRRTPSRRIACLTVGAALALAGCGGGPEYPPDWPALSEPKRARKGESCPDLSGSYQLPYGGDAVRTRVKKKEKRTVITTNTFLTATAGREASGRMHSSSALTRMVLEGPAEQGLKVVFLDRRNAVLSEHLLRPGIDYRCRGAWISDAKPSHTAADPPYFYAKDVEGRLVGQIAFSGSGVALILGFIPLPVLVDDRVWWRIEPTPDARP